MFATWHVLRQEGLSKDSAWRPAGTSYWQVGGSAGDRIAPAAPGCWSYLGLWPDEVAAVTAERALAQGDTASEAWHLHLRPVSGHGDAPLVGGATPFADLPRAAAVDGPVAVLTLAMVVPDPAVQQMFFGAAFGPVAASLAEEPGCLALSNQRAAEIDGFAAFTFTVWDELRAATAWAYRSGPHRTMLDRSGTEVMFTGSGFWRFAVLSSSGTVNGHDPLAVLQDRTASFDRTAGQTANASVVGAPRTV